ncbi:MAG: hypothetical protein MI755_15400 [Sphingomonadales bacterium]|nr:hypothetical protein [Sphingomonadales bacterium]
MFNFWRLFLLGVGIVTVLSGLQYAFLGDHAVTRMLTEPIIVSLTGTAAMAPETARIEAFYLGIIGAVTAGLGVQIEFLALFPFKKREKWAWFAAATSVGAWYVIDTGLAFAAGVPSLVTANTIFAALVALPLIFTFRDFFPSRAASVAAHAQ